MCEYLFLLPSSFSVQVRLDAIGLSFAHPLPLFPTFHLWCPTLWGTMQWEFLLGVHLISLLKDFGSPLCLSWQVTQSLLGASNSRYGKIWNSCHRREPPPPVCCLLVGMYRVWIPHNFHGSHWLMPDSLTYLPHQVWNAGSVSYRSPPHTPHLSALLSLESSPAPALSSGFLTENSRYEI